VIPVNAQQQNETSFEWNNLKINFKYNLKTAHNVHGRFYLCQNCTQLTAVKAVIDAVGFPFVFKKKKRKRKKGVIDELTTWLMPLETPIPANQTNQLHSARES